MSDRQNGGSKRKLLEKNQAHNGEDQRFAAFSKQLEAVISRLTPWEPSTRINSVLGL